MIKVSNLSYGYGRKYLVRDLNATFRRGEITAITGRSGIGKSTFLKSINRLHEVERSDFFREGRIEIETSTLSGDVSSIEPHILRRSVGYIFQSPIPLPMSVEKNVSFAMDVAGCTREGAVRDALQSAHLWAEVKDRLDEDASRLSLGQQQRLAIARVLVMESEIILFDEPTSSLDPNSTRMIEELMVELSKEKTILLVSHDMEQIGRVADDVIALEEVSSNIR